jgi:hypothetical protein
MFWIVNRYRAAAPRKSVLAQERRKKIPGKSAAFRKAALE